MTRSIAVGSDHAGIALRRQIVAHLRARGLTVVVEAGPEEGERSDYPDQAAAVATAIIDGIADLGVLICGTGIGISIAANKIAGVRAALVHDPVTASLATEHNNANVVCLGARLLAAPYAIGLVDTWLDATFETRHQHRLDKVHALEEAG